MGKYEKLLAKKVGLVSTFDMIRIKRETVVGNWGRSHHYLWQKNQKINPMLTYLSSSIWASPAQTLVNTINVVGLRYPSKLEYVEAGLNEFAGHYE